MSRAGAQRHVSPAHAGTPVWVWIVYVLGFLGGVVLAGSAAASAVVVLISDATVDISFRALAVCVVLVGAAVALKAWRWRRSHT